MLPEKQPLEPRGIVGELVIVPKFLEQEQYSRAGDFLEESLGYQRGRDLLEFAYDWRLDVRESARRLAEAIDAWGVTPPVTLIAHSLGTLVSRYYIERLGGKDKIGRALLIGGPHQGTPRIVSDLIQGVGLLPFGLLGDRLRDIIKTFPSVYQILPTYPSRPTKMPSPSTCWPMRPGCRMNRSRCCAWHGNSGPSWARPAACRPSASTAMAWRP